VLLNWRSGNSALPVPQAAPGNPALTAGDWITLFDGRDVSGWKGGKSSDFPDGAWGIENGALRNFHGAKHQDLETREHYRNFELEFEWKLSPGGNSGIFYGTREFQLVDDAGHANGKVPVTSCGALCYFIPPNANKKIHPAGTYNLGKLTVRGNQVEHWINGEKVVAYELGSPALKNLVASDQFKSLPGYRRMDTEAGEVPIGLQSHSGNVWFRNIRIRKLDGSQANTGTPIKRTIDLLALADPTKDRIAVINGESHSRRNNWKRVNDALVYTSDGGSGKIASPVAIDSNNYEIEVAYERVSGNGRLHVDIPLIATAQGMTLIPIYLDAPEFQMVGMKSGGSWPVDGKSSGLAVIRLARETDGNLAHITVTVDGVAMVNWKGDVTSVAYSINEIHPDFPDKPVPSIYSHKDSYQINSWRLRLFDGEAKVLREASDFPSLQVPPTSPKGQVPINNKDAKNPDLDDGLLISYGMQTFTGLPTDNGKTEADPKRFAPGDVAVESWPRLAKEAGMSFAVMNVKHSSGFRVWDAPFDNFDIGGSPFKRDLLAEFIDSCNAVGLMPGANFIVTDVHREGGYYRTEPVAATHLNLIKQELGDLLTRYSELRVLALGHFGRFSPQQAAEIRTLVQSINPQCVILDDGASGRTYQPISTVKGWFHSPTQPEMPTLGELSNEVRKWRAQDVPVLVNVGPDRDGKIPREQRDLLMKLHPPQPGTLQSSAVPGGSLPWTNTDGITIQAEFVRLDGQSVVIRKDGKEFTLRLAQLSTKSRQQALDLANGAKPASE
jgi:hypothetical protein